jgi:hypothetical protein
MRTIKDYFFSPKIIVRESSIHGLGLFLGQDANRGEILITAGGKLIPFADVPTSTDKSYTYLPAPMDGLVLYLETDLRFQATRLNHSCQPNLTYDFPSWRASSDLRTGVEVTTDYGLLGYSAIYTGPLLRGCNCSSEICRNIIF